MVGAAKAVKTFVKATFTLEEKDGKRYWKGGEFGGGVTEENELKFPVLDFPIGSRITIELPMTRTRPPGGNGEE